MYIEEGIEVNAQGACVEVFCIIDSKTHEQIGESFDTEEEAKISINRISASPESDRK